jgi:hypothetical protein
LARVPISLKEGISLILKADYFLKPSFLSLMFWHACFDRRSEVASKIPIWVNIPELPLDLYTNKFLEEVGSELIKVIMIDLSFKSSAFVLWLRFWWIFI